MNKITFMPLEQSKSRKDYLPYSKNIALGVEEPIERKMKVPSFVNQKQLVVQTFAL